ncbi:hypothetical protein SDJN02_04991 [Cucurbita argyrosperma subsp. argyrosperma]|nr:hypothetical protein SDJN02_04991 [Cucurbita argyrosperma subsp. argyrosperma]
MGGGNGQKAKMAREKNLEKQKGAKGSQLDSNKKAMTIQVTLIDCSAYSFLLFLGFDYALDLFTLYRNSVLQ